MDRCAIVTGVARRCGIGRCIVDRFLNEGYKVVGVDFREMEEIPKAKQFCFLRADVSDPSQAEAIVSQTLEHFGDTIHVLVNNAARTSHLLPGESPIQAFDSMIKSNLCGPFYLSECVVPHMPAGDASIIHMSSTRARQSQANTPGYTASKAGLCGLTHSQAITYAGRVRVNAILPGWINTDPSPEALREEDHEWHPAGRVGVPDDVAQLCSFLSDATKSGFITGQEFVIDGGTTVKMVYPPE